MTRPVACLVWLLTAVVATPSAAQTCQGAAPRVNKPGFRHRQTITFSVAASPTGEPFPDDRRACVWRAFQAWNEANAATALGVTFVPGPDGVVVRYDRHRGKLADRVAGAWYEVERSDDGALEQAEIWLSPDRRLVDSCDGITKIVLHELGHLHGLADELGQDGATVMHHPREKNDRSGRIPLLPTACDAAQAVAASSIVGAVWIDAGRPSWAGGGASRFIR